VLTGDGEHRITTAWGLPGNRRTRRRTNRQDRAVEQTWIPMSAGVRLAVTLYLPDGANRVPCLLEALPYRKDDLTASYRPEYTRFRDEFGYAVARVDLRGTGSSSGIALDEYHAQEQADLLEVIAWLAHQPWCSGSVGMFGTSWSGFNALQLACERPPALKAIVASYATDDRWTDDVHHMGGAMRLLDQVDYQLYMVAMNGLPPVPSVFGEGWRQEWLARAQDTPEWFTNWIDRQSDGPYWRHGSVRATPGPAGAGMPSYERITCPTMIIAGWADGYRNNSFRTFEALSAVGTPVQVLAGPWSHMGPSTAVPGPRVDHVVLMARWWDRWLRDGAGQGEQGATGRPVVVDPPFTVFVRRYEAPSPTADTWPGSWQAYDRAGLAAVRPVVLELAGATTSGGAPQPDHPEVVEYPPVRDVGVRAWNSCVGHLPWGQPEDQSLDEARSLCLQWSLPEGTVVLGQPRLQLRVRVDDPVTFVSAKLSLVPPSGRPSLLVDRGLLNLAYRDGDGTRPRACAPGEWHDVEIELEATAFEVTDGVRLRLALACADWPNVVAPPGTWSAVDLSASRLLLPVSPGTPLPAPVLPDPPTEQQQAAAAPTEPVEASHVQWRHGHEVVTGVHHAEVDHGSTYRGFAGSVCREHYVGRVEIDPATGRQRAVARTRFELTWPDGAGGDTGAEAADGPVRATSESRLDLVIDDDTFDVTLELDVLDGDQPLAQRRWHRRIQRHLA
jgi:uncharacterized protein